MSSIFFTSSSLILNLFRWPFRAVWLDISYTPLLFCLLCFLKLHGFSHTNKLAVLDLLAIKLNISWLKSSILYLLVFGYSGGCSILFLCYLYFYFSRSLLSLICINFISSRWLSGVLHNNFLYMYGLITWCFSLASKYQWYSLTWFP